MDDRVVYSGRARTIEWAVLPNGKVPGLKGWRKLSVGLRAKLFTTIKRLGDYGECQNEERFKHERKKIWTIKAWKVRVYCFMSTDRRIVLTHIASKKTDKAARTELDRAETIQGTCMNP